MPREESGGPLELSGRNDFAYYDFGGGEELFCGFEGFRAREEYSQRITAHDGFVLLCILEGRGFFRSSHSSEETYAPGRMIQRYPAEDHEITLDAGATFQGCYIKVPSALLPALRASGVITIPHAALLSVNAALFSREVDHLLGEVRSGARSIDLMVAIHSLVRNALETGRNPSSARDVLIAEASRLIREGCTERINLSSVALHLGVSYSCLRQEFRRLTGLSPGEFRIRCRTEEAQRMLGRSHDPVKTIAFRLKYPDCASFCRQFQQVTGLTPKAFRERGRLQG